MLLSACCRTASAFWLFVGGDGKSLPYDMFWENPNCRNVPVFRDRSVALSDWRRFGFKTQFCGLPLDLILVYHY